MENHVNQSPAIPKWSALLIEAVTKPGLIMKAYSAFHQLFRWEPNSRACAMSDARITARPN